MSRRKTNCQSSPRKDIKPEPRIGSHVGWRPSGPVRLMLGHELRSQNNKSRLMDDLVVRALAAKYPKLAERYQILREELCPEGQG